MPWPTWVPRWSIIAAAAILAASILGTVLLAVGNSADAPAPTAPATTAAPAPSSTAAFVPTTVPGTPAEVSPDTVHLRIAALAAELAGTAVVVRTDAGEVELTVADLGISLEHDATFDAVRQRRAGSDDAGGPDESWVAWSTDPAFSERRYLVDRSMAQAALASAAELGVTATAPSIVVVNDTLAVDLGLPGQVVDTDAIVDEVLGGVARSFARIEITAELVESEPLAYTPELQEAVNAAHESYGRGLAVAFGGATHDITIETVAGWLTLDASASPPLISFDLAQVGPYLAETFADASAPFTEAAMVVRSGVPTVVASDGGVACCADTAGALVEEALRARVEGLIELPARPAVSPQEQAHMESLGIVELVATFTTRHACCQGRVKNIQRFADLMRGAIVLPGESLSLNGHVGRRTEAKGFVEGGFIEKGVLIDDIGGGVSQFATTIFNSLIHAGMDIDEYQTHSLYLSRYPFGLDPTISYPRPDLAFTNPTPYAVLIWPTYTDTSITVELYSTRNVEVTIGAPQEEMREFCRRVRTDRTRVFSDGTADTDSFFARYRPEEGRNCDGSRSVPRQCVDPLADPSDPPLDEDGEPLLVDDGSEREDGSVVECAPLECTEKPGERDAEAERYPDDPCLGVDLEALADDDGSDGDGSDTGTDGEDDGTGTDGGHGDTGDGGTDSGDGTDGDGTDSGDGDGDGDGQDGADGSQSGDGGGDDGGNGNGGGIDETTEPQQS